MLTEESYKKKVSFCFFLGGLCSRRGMTSFFFWHMMQVVVDGNRINLEILDTAGQKEFQAFRDVTIGYADGFLVIFSLTNRESFEEAKALARETRDNFHKPLVMAGNKKVIGGVPLCPVFSHVSLSSFVYALRFHTTCVLLCGGKGWFSRCFGQDLVDERTVSYDEASKFCKDNNIPYSECSAKVSQTPDHGSHPLFPIAPLDPATLAPSWFESIVCVVDGT